MKEGTEIPQIKEIKRKEGVKLTVKSCYPKNANLAEQFEKLSEELMEISEAENYGEAAVECLDAMTVLAGLSEMLITRRIDKIEGVNQVTVAQEALQKHLDNQYQRKQEEWKQEEKCGLDPEVIE